MKGSVVDSDGRLKPADQIIGLNGKELLTASRQQITELLKVWPSYLLAVACVCWLRDCAAVAGSVYWRLWIEMGKNANPARTNQSTTQVLSRTEPNPKVKNVQEPELNRTERYPVKNLT